MCVRARARVVPGRRDVDMTMAEDGTGTITVVATADAESFAAVPTIADELALDDVIAAGWTVDGPTATPDGGLTITISHPFTSAEEATNLLNSIGPPFNQMSVHAHDGEQRHDQHAERAARAVERVRVVRRRRPDRRGRVGAVRRPDRGERRHTGDVDERHDCGRRCPARSSPTRRTATIARRRHARVGRADGRHDRRAAGAQSQQSPANNAWWARPLSIVALVALIAWVVFMTLFIGYVACARSRRSRRYRKRPRPPTPPVLISLDPRLRQDFWRPGRAFLVANVDSVWEAEGMGTSPEPRRDHPGRLPLRRDVSVRLSDGEVDPRRAGPERARDLLEVLQPGGGQPGRGQEASVGTGVVVRLVDDAHRRAAAAVEHGRPRPLVRTSGPGAPRGRPQAARPRRRPAPAGRDSGSTPRSSTRRSPTRPRATR